MHLSSIPLACAALVAVALGAAAPPSSSYHVTRRGRSIFALECQGHYDAAIFARLDRLCVDCYNFFRKPEVYTICRKGCFTGDYFKKCVKVLQETDHLEEYKEYIRKLHGAVLPSSGN